MWCWKDLWLAGYRVFGGALGKLLITAESLMKNLSPTF
jgi:hypothetical protein